MFQLIKKKPQADKKVLTAQQFINVKDIKGKILYSRDNHVFAYIKVYPVSIDLLSENEKMSLCKSLSAELSSEKNPLNSLPFPGQWIYLPLLMRTCGFTLKALI